MSRDISPPRESGAPMAAFMNADFGGGDGLKAFFAALNGRALSQTAWNGLRELPIQQKRPCVALRTASPILSDSENFPEKIKF